MYYLFFKQRIQFFVVPSLIVSIIFILYQIIIFRELASQQQHQERWQGVPQVRGAHPHDFPLYLPNSLGKFTCIKSLEMVDLSFVNDDYCDCEDGTDEPGTNACSNGQFYCLLQGRRGLKAVPSNRVNDGICDCCDGTDEWSSKQCSKVC